MAPDWLFESISSLPGCDTDMNFNDFGLDHVRQPVQDATKASSHHQTAAAASDVSLGSTDDADTTPDSQTYTSFPPNIAATPLSFGHDELGRALLDSLDPKLDQRTPLAYSRASTNPLVDTLNTLGDSTLSCHNNGVKALPNPATFCIQQLAGLSVSLHEHAATVPPLSSQSLPSQAYQWKDVSPVESETGELRTPNNTPPSKETQNCQGFEIDHTFRLTQSLIDIYPCCISTAIERQQTHSTPQNLQDDHESASLQSIAETNDPRVRLHRKPMIDEASILLLLSCHLRLLDIYETIFGHIQACIEGFKRSRNNAEQTIHASELRVGSFVPSASVAIPMQVMLVIHLASQLLDRARELVHEVETQSPSWRRREDAELAFADDGDGGTVSSGCQGPGGQGDDATGTMCKTVMNRAKGMSQNINRLRPTLLQLAGM
ncbi:MAG: hypothetical protein Q9217_001178 [Psora testacea]